MAISVLMLYGKLMKDHGYTTKMWEDGYGANEANDVCHELTKWAQEDLQLDGEFLVLWTYLNGTEFSGDNELVYVDAQGAYLIPNPFLEGDSEGFIVGMQKILNGDPSDLYEVSIQNRILYNAV